MNAAYSMHCTKNMLHLFLLKHKFFVSLVVRQNLFRKTDTTVNCIFRLESVRLLTTPCSDSLKVRKWLKVKKKFELEIEKF